MESEGATIIRLEREKADLLEALRDVLSDWPTISEATRDFCRAALAKATASEGAI